MKKKTFWKIENVLNKCTKWLVYSPPIIYIILAILFATSCASKKEVVHDEHNTATTTTDSTLVSSAKTDSVSVGHTTNTSVSEVVNNSVETLKHDSTIVVVDVSGNVVTKEIWHTEKTIVEHDREYEKTLQDSIDMYRSVNDSLMAYISKYKSLEEMINHEEEKVVEKTKIPTVFWISMIFCVLFIFYIVSKVVQSWKI